MENRLSQEKDISSPFAWPGIDFLHFIYPRSTATIN
jgi:hypothetical protein